MNLHFGSQPAIPLALLFISMALPLHAGEASAAEAARPAPPGPAAKPAPENASAAKASATAGDSSPQRLAIPPRAFRLKGQRAPAAPLKHLSFSTNGGFALRMSGDQEITAEIRNGAGRTLAYTSRTLEPGEWTLRPRNLAPGLYTVWLRTGPNLRALRMKIEDVERGQGQPEWVLERATDSTAAPESAPRGAIRSPAPPFLAAGPASPR